MKDYKLSYIFCTRNRLPFLKINLKYLFENIRDDEEIVIVDGDSNDGTKEYLQSLYEQGKIHQFISEPDRNQAHGWNKAILMARGQLIKKIIDDDLFCFPAIQACKNYMLEHPEIDLCISNTLGTNLANYRNINQESVSDQYLRWRNGDVKSFFFCDISLLLRKNSISLLGLYDVSFTMMDYEFALRVSYLRANIAYYTGYNAISIFHSNNVTSNVPQKRRILEGKRANPMYEYNPDISVWSKTKIFIGKNLQRFGIWKKKSEAHKDKQTKKTELESIYDYCYKKLNKFNIENHGKFL